MKALMFLLLSGLCGCVALAPKPMYRVTGASPGAEMATVDLGDAEWVRIDDRHLVKASQYGSIGIPPGAHRIEWGHSFGFSVMVEASMSREFQGIRVLNFQPGHHYRLRAGRTYGRAYHVFFWIEDGEKVVAGIKPGE